MCLSNEKSILRIIDYSFPIYHSCAFATFQSLNMDFWFMKCYIKYYILFSRVAYLGMMGMVIYSGHLHACMSIYSCMDKKLTHILVNRCCVISIIFACCDRIAQATLICALQYEIDRKSTRLNSSH